MAPSRNNNTPQLRPTAEQTFELEGQGPWNFLKRQQRALELQESGQVEAACEERYRAVQALEEALPEEEEIALNWEHANSRAALEILRASAIDHFLIGDLELATALLELLLELDPEDHLGAIEQLAWLYVALEEYELLEEILPDLSEKSAERYLVQLWASFRQTGTLAEEPLQVLKRRFAPYWAEFTAESHPADEAYLRAIGAEHPTAAALARELWLRTEPLWLQEEAFIEALRHQK